MKTYLNGKWIGNARSAWGLGVCRGLSLSTSRKDFEAEALDVARRTSAEFRFRNVVSAIDLVRLDEMLADGMRNEIRQLKPDRIMFLVHEPNIEVRHLADRIMPVADSAKLKLQSCVFHSSATLDLNVG